MQHDPRQPQRQMQAQTIASPREVEPVSRSTESSR
jgi:hypothetical protein